MKHPNKKAEAQNRWQLQFHQQIRKSRELSCFNFWLGKQKPAGFIQMTNNGLLEALTKL